jgi:hypothetical protein
MQDSIKDTVFSLDISKLNTGHYFVNLVSHGEVTTKLFVKK